MATALQPQYINFLQGAGGSLQGSGGLQSTGGGQSTTSGTAIQGAGGASLASSPSYSTNITDPLGGATSTYGSTGSSSGTTSADLAAAQKQVADQLALYNHNFDLSNQDINQSFANAQQAHDTQANSLNDYYTSQQQGLDQTKGQADQSLSQLMAARGLGAEDTPYQNAQSSQNQNYQNQVLALHQDQVSKLSSLDNTLQQAQQQLNLQKQSIDTSQFQNLDQLQSYLSQFDAANNALNTQRNQIKSAILGSTNAIKGITTSGAYNTANAQSQMIANINKMIAAGTSAQQIRGYINQGANKTELQGLLDYYQKAATPAQQGATA